MDELVYGRVGLWMSWSVDELVVDELDCGRVDLLPGGQWQY